MNRHEVFYIAKAAGGPEALAEKIGVPIQAVQRGIEIGISDPDLADAIRAQAPPRPARRL